MVKDLAVSNRCRGLAARIQETEFLGREELFGPYFPGVPPQSLARYMTHPKAKWKPPLIHGLAAATKALYGFDPAEVAAHLNDGDLRANRSIVDLIHGRRVQANQLQSLAMLSQKLEECTRDHPHQILSLHRRSPFRHMPDGYIEAWVQFEQEVHGFDERVRKTKVELATACRDEFLAHYKPGKTRSVSGWLQSGLLELQNYSGHARYLTAEDIVEFALDLHSNAIKEKAVDVRVIADGPGQLPDPVADWIRTIDLAVAVDEHFLMKVLHGGAARVFFQRGVDREQDRQLDEQLGLLKQALEFRAHDACPAGVIKWLGALADRVKIRRDAIHAEKIRGDLERPDICHEGRNGFYLPNGTWLDYVD